ncbi:helix-turn-helix transcriptional regulator [Salipaludibacillus agaradhaerens]|jgi:transcriptional regulator with XRE-family HTH domain|uniref:Helix-turn-helix transcriptional regulator n=1 Tax=Salipaludibacillus agaradhaerens TaxID=76935 RepID=A0A9Q4FX87_SALAG|nr:helix-turn-helix transcriptional regulator [Salipaludibacillus agaradhaerens]MCR6095221.1 helix-turn-helix transcriptional regulator [Salipaludibacillus agaradhaerens]MCR6115221.1 helix-turn-helix transcriptional regulator [Salipaludibacillus agaradhaerens]
MTAFDRVKKLCEEKRISVVELEEKLNFSRNSLYSWKKNKPSSDKLEKVADFFNVTTDYLLGRTDKKRYYDLTEKDEKDIQKELEKMINNLSSNTGYAAFDGSSIDELDEEDRELLIASLENTLRLSKRLAKQKFTPQKFRD